MKFTPKTEKEIAEANLWPAGEYSFEVLEAADKISKVKPDGSGGNEMIELKLKVYNDDGAFIFLNDYLLESMAAKLRYAADACGLIDQYDNGVLTANDFVGNSGTVKLKIKKDKEGQYPDKNEVAGYVKRAAGSLNGTAAVATGPAFIDDTVPF